MIDDEVVEIRTSLAFLRSVIKSGEPWTEDCEEQYRKASKACDRLRALTEDMRLETLRGSRRRNG